MARLRDQRGTAAIELALFLPLLVFVAVAATGIVRLVLDTSHLDHVAQAGARYATRAAPGADRGEYRLRPTAAEVEAYVRAIADMPIESVEVAPDPSTALPGTAITVTVHARRDLGIVASSANALGRVVAGGPVFTDGGIGLSSTAVMREE